jgi:hypothetical protein
MEELVIYELHVRGFTAHPSSGVSAPGTYSALREKIPYLKSLGVNCVELMPIQEFDEFDGARLSPVDGRQRNTDGRRDRAAICGAASWRDATPWPEVLDAGSGRPSRMVICAPSSRSTSRLTKAVPAAPAPMMTMRACVCTMAARAGCTAAAVASPPAKSPMNARRDAVN